jgi:acyl carrier protein
LAPTAAEHDRITGERLRMIVAAVLEIDVAEIDIDMRFYDDLAASSLEKVEIAVRVEREFGVDIEAEEAAGLTSLADTLALLREKGAIIS